LAIALARVTSGQDIGSRKFVYMLDVSILDRVAPDHLFIEFASSGVDLVCPYDLHPGLQQAEIATPAAREQRYS
jgi:hypothetical protein